MTTERKHRCGGTLRPGRVSFQDQRDGMLMTYNVPGLVCERCGEELVDRQTALALEQTPATIWLPRVNEPASSLLLESVFGETVGTTGF